MRDITLLVVSGMLMLFCLTCAFVTEKLGHEKCQVEMIRQHWPAKDILEVCK